MTWGLALAGALGLALASATADPVVEDAPSAEVSVFRQLAEAKSPDPIWERSFVAMIDRAKIAFLDEPKFAQADRECPGLIDAIFVSAGPLMHARHFADRDRLREGMTRIFADGLTEDQAREALAFYQSKEGLFLLELGADSNNYEEKFAAAMAGDDGKFDRGAFERDLERTHDDSIRNADPRLVDRVTDQLQASSWFGPYLKIHSRIQDLRFAITKAPRDPARAQLIDQAVKRGAIQHFVNCGKSVPLRTP